MSTDATRRPLSTEGPSAGGERLDDIEDYEWGGDDDPFGDGFVERQKPKETPKETSKDTTNNAGKKGKKDDGLDEVKVEKIRAPRVKLDEKRLLSAAGIPKLRKRAKAHLKFKGKGHEYSDATRLLQFYQLWLDDLFPKARFLDALAMVEKMGHKKQLQTARMEWINEGKPRSSVHEDSIFDDPELPPRENNEGQNTALRTAPIFEKSTTERTKTPEVDADIEIDDIYDATPRPNRTKATQQVSQTDSLFGGAGRSIFGNGNTTATDDFPDGDMEALLAEQEAMRGSPKSVQHPAAKSTAPEDDFEDDLDALMAEQEAEREALQVTSKPAQPPAAKAPHEDEFGDDLEALIAEEEMMQASLKPAQVSIAKTTPPTDEFDDDMEAMAEMDAMW